MNVVEDKQTDTLEARHVAEDHKDEPGPVYTKLSQDPSCSSQAPRQLANYLHISRTHTDIKETYTIDPTLNIPAFLLPPLGKDESEETRRNLRLETTHGTIGANVRLVDGEAQGEKKGKRVTMVMKSEHGAITATIVRAATRPPFHIHLSTNGDICLHIPRSYHGPITVSLKYGSFKCAESLAKCLTTFNEVNGLSRGFIGDFSAADFRGGEHGHVRVEFDDNESDVYMNDPPLAYEKPHQNPSCSQIAIRPANYISISRMQSIKEAMNLRLEATHGSINAIVRIVEGEGGFARKRKRVTMMMNSERGGITAQIMDTQTRPPFHIHLKSANGDIRLHIPRSYHGPIAVSITRGSLRSLTNFSEVDGVRTGFIGDVSAVSEKGTQSWDGDEIYVEAKHGHVRVLFDDDEDERDSTGKLSFWNWLFGWVGVVLFLFFVLCTAYILYTLLYVRLYE
ncbi:hypothetical protein BDQ17DRAFT_1370174 [Cyathus striatus]|nr:hypothetical protein BDQ17DRAFT_1370174 [Cyathus striatus]